MKRRLLGITWALQEGAPNGHPHRAKERRANFIFILYAWVFPRMHVSISLMRLMLTEPKRGHYKYPMSITKNKIK